MSSDAKLESKIAKLFAKAERTDNADEAEAYTALAERLMIKWGISEARVRGASSAEQEQVGTVKVMITGRYSLAQVQLCNQVTKGLGGTRMLVRNWGGNRRELWFIGYPGDIQRARELMDSLWLQAASAKNAWWGTHEERHYMTANEKFVAQRSFLLAFAATVGKRLTVARTEEEATAEQEQPGTALVLVSREEQVQQRAEQLSSGRTSGGTRTADRAGAQAGRAAGKKAKLTQSAGIKGGRTAIN